MDMGKAALAVRTGARIIAKQGRALAVIVAIHFWQKDLLRASIGPGSLYEKG